MDRRAFLKASAASCLTPLVGTAQPAAAANEKLFVRVRPGDSAWPSQARWNELFNAVGGRLVRLDDPLASCRVAPDRAACQAFFKAMRNPYFISDNPAVTVETGARWLAVYDAVTTRGGRYVQGGGCTTVGVAGFIHGGGFGSFSKKYGQGAAGLLEAEIVTADGSVLVVNACNHPDLF